MCTQGGVLYAAVLQTALHLVLHEAVTTAEVGQPHRALLIHRRTSFLPRKGRSKGIRSSALSTVGG